MMISNLRKLPASVLCLFGVMHSPTPQATLFLPWRAGSSIPLHVAAAYVALAMTILVIPRLARQEDPPQTGQEKSGS